MKVFALCSGWLTAPGAASIEDAEPGMMTVPMLSFLIDHPRVLAVFDTGLPPEIVADPEKVIGKFLSGVFTADYGPAHDLPALIAALGYEPRQVTTVINSHSHFDHCGGNHLFPHARIILQQREAEIALDAPKPRNGFDTAAAYRGRQVEIVDGVHDVFGDGAAVLFPTFGHTAGHQSLHLHCQSGEAVLAGDCCYFHRTLKDKRLPGFAHDKGEQLASLERLAALDARGVQVIAGHDPAQWVALSAAPGPFLSG